MRPQSFTTSASSALAISSESLPPIHLLWHPQPPALRRPSHIPTHRSLYARISDLLRLNKLDTAVCLYQQHVTRKTRDYLRDEGSFDSNQSARHTALLRTAQLFRSYGHPQLTIQALESLKAYMDLVNDSKPPSAHSSHTQAAVLFMQACNELSWTPTSAHPASGRSNSVCHHTELGKLLARLTHPIENLDHNKPLKKNAGRIKEESIRIRTVEESKVLQVILGTILKLGEPDWLISILKQVYPRFITQLGIRLYPLLNFQSMTTSPWNPDHIPNGRLVKFLIASYTLSGDLDRAYIVWRFYRKLWNQYMKAKSRDPAPDITLLRALSRSSQRSDKEVRMVIKILQGMETDHIPLDTYVIEGLMDLRYRMRSRWSLRKPHAAAFQVLQKLLDKSIGLFLLHWRRPSSFGLPSPCSQNYLIQGALQGQRQLMTWKYRPTARSFTLALLSLRSELKYKAISGFRKRPSTANTIYQVDQNPQCSQSRPSPGSHRHLISQLIALENLNAVTGQKPSSKIDSKIYLPNRLRLLTPTNLRLSFQVFLCAKDYAGACFVLRHASSACQHMSPILFELVIRKVPESIKNGLLLPTDYDAFLNYVALARHRNDLQKTKVEDTNTSSTSILRSHSELSGTDNSTQLDVFKALEILLRCCEPGRPDTWWQSELAAVYRRLAREEIRMAEIVNQPAFSEFTLDFLRTQAAHQQLRQLFHGLNY
ncbi:hypothetical protein CROQUDRAFT_134331 [Cronartium quercuum f. sp. fusiforme G11]|uniref:Uncharacterized protein n=1 Tax=Cronartium quercuum f. sp. fusiforme G11 TaxID=708437 RepID=A0A9P6TAC9_9BASI|nr:hypothetical protein CROQUDRAFT_134331 [Cronartium quercuum f. sp. fusiforme G11]